MRLFKSMFLSMLLILPVAACTDDGSSQEGNNETEQNNDNSERDDENNGDNNSHDNDENNEETDKAGPEEEITLETGDGEVRFELEIMRGDLTEKEIESLKERVLDAYADVKGSIDTSYAPKDEVTIQFHKGMDTSTGFASDITLYADEIANYQVVHEMTHTILGFGQFFDISRGYVTQEGFANYMEEEYGSNSVGFTDDSFMKFLIDKDYVLPVSQLMNSRVESKYFRPGEDDLSGEFLQYLSYVHAGSFIGYLIEEYGIEEFENVYNQPNLDDVLQEVYEKSVSELETEWLEQIEETESNVVEEVLGQEADRINEQLESIDSDLFK